MAIDLTNKSADYIAGRLDAYLRDLPDGEERRQVAACVRELLHRAKRTAAPSGPTFTPWHNFGLAVGRILQTPDWGSRELWKIAEAAHAHGIPTAEEFNEARPGEYLYSPPCYFCQNKEHSAEDCPHASDGQKREGE